MSQFALSFKHLKVQICIFFIYYAAILTVDTDQNNVMHHRNIRKQIVYFVNVLVKNLPIQGATCPTPTF